MANKQEKDNKVEESIVPETTAMTNPDTKAVKNAEAEPEKKGLWATVKSLSTPMKVGLGVVGGAILTGLGFGVKFLVDAFMNQEDNDSSDDSPEDSGPEDE